MRPKRPKAVAQLLDINTGTLAKLQHGAQQINQISGTIRQILPDVVANQITVANFRDGVLVLQVPSAAWAQRMRFSQTLLINQLRKQLLPSLSTINVQICPSRPTIPSTKQTESQSRKISISAAEQLKELAEHAPEALKRQLLKLASHGT
jgi:hypothetical protein